MNNLEIDKLSLTLHRTVRVKNDDNCSNLPPSLGNFEVYKVSDFKDKCPENWEEDAYFLAMHSEEAMWMSFQTIEPIAVMIGAGSINALNGKTLDEKLEKDNYLVTPPQPWLDGWKSEDGTVYQFVITEVGENKTIGEQLTQTKDHAIVISVFNAKHPEKLKCDRPITTWGDCEKGDLDYSCDEDYFVPMKCCGSLGAEMGVGKGGKINQKIYEDPHGLEEWEEKPTKTVKLYLTNASAFSEITGKEMPLPVKAEDYNGLWYGLEDKTLKEIKSISIFDKLKSAIIG